MDDFTGEAEGNEPTEDLRRFTIYFKINSPDSQLLTIPDLRAGEYLRLKLNKKYAWDFIINLVNDDRVYVEDKKVNFVWISTDDVQYDILTPPETPTDPSAQPEKENQLTSNKAHTSDFNSENQQALKDIEPDKNTKKIVNKGIRTGLIRIPSKHDDTRNKKRESEVWTYFEAKKKDDPKSKCLLCNKLVSHNGNTTNLKNHLKINHPTKEIFEKFVNQEKKNKQCKDEDDSPISSKKIKSCMQAPQIDEIFNEVNSFKNGKRSENLHEAILFMISKDKMPTSTVDNEGFRKFCKVAVPHYQIPSRKNITTRLELKYRVLQEKIANEFQNLKAYCITFDMWTDCCLKSYLGVTIHFLEHRREMRNRSIGVFTITDSHTAENIIYHIQDIFNKFSIKTDRIQSAVADGASNMKKIATDMFGSERYIWCVAHRLSKLVPSVLENMENLSAIISKVRQICSFMRKSTTAVDELQSLQKNEGIGQNHRKIVLIDTQIRWSSTFYMIQRFLELIDYIYIIKLKCPGMPQLLTHSELSAIKDLEKLMQPAERAINFISGHSYPTCTGIIPMINGMKKSLLLYKPKTAQGLEFCSKFLNTIEKRFNNIETHHLFAPSTILDPRFKTVDFENAENVAEAKKIIELELINLETSLEVQKSLKPEPAPASANNLSIWMHHEEAVKIYNRRLTTDHNIFEEFSRYLSEPIIDLEENPLSWWDVKKTTYPSLSQIALKFLPIICTSVPTERLFSEAGAIKTASRNRLTGEHLNELLFCGSLSEQDWFL